MAPPTSSSASAPSSLQEMLLQAAADGDLHLLKSRARALDNGRGRLREAVEAARDHGAGALHVSACCETLCVCRYLVEELRVDVDAVDLEGETPLAYAVHSASVATVRYLLDHGANPDKADIKGFVPLHYAAEEGHCEIVELLLAKGAYVDSVALGGTPLHSAAIKGQAGTLKILLDHKADCNKIARGIFTPLLLAIYAPSLKCVKLLIEAGADVNGVGPITPFMAAAFGGLTECMECLLEAGADPSVPDDDSVCKKTIADLKLQGSEAVKKKDYFAAAVLYSMAMCLDRNDATLFANRSLCFLHIGDGDKASRDAQTCRMIRPDWPEAHYRMGAALMLLKDYEKACDALLYGFKLDPANVEIENALRVALQSLKISRGANKT